MEPGSCASCGSALAGRVCRVSGESERGWHWGCLRCADCGRRLRGSAWPGLRCLACWEADPATPACSVCQRPLSGQVSDEIGRCDHEGCRSRSNRPLGDGG